MASIRKLKKTIRFISSEGIRDCLNLSDLFGGKNEDEIMSLIQQITVHHNNAIKELQHVEGQDDPKLVKQHYRKVKEDYKHGMEDSFKKISELLQVKRKEIEGSLS